MSADKVLLSSSVTVADYLGLVARDERKAVGAFIKQRFEERYLAPALDANTRHGFSMMAIACLTIEALQSFRLGLGSTRNMSGAMFTAFFKDHRGFADFADGDWFFMHIRCGILHLGEARGGWRILRRGVLVDKHARTINATRFLKELRAAVNAYATDLEGDDQLWSLFEKKMKQVVKNCEP